MVRSPERANINAFYQPSPTAIENRMQAASALHRGRSSPVGKKKEKEDLFSYTTVQLRNVYLDSVGDADCHKHASF